MRGLNVRNVLFATVAGVCSVQMVGTAMPCPPGEEKEQKVVITTSYVQDKDVYKVVDTTINKASTIVLKANEDGRVVEVRVQPIDTSKKAYVLVADTISIADVRGKATGNLVLTAEGNVALAALTVKRTPSVQIGVVTEALSKALAGHLKIRPEEALIVTGVAEGLPAAKAGLKEYDVIISVDGEKKITHVNLKAVLSNCKPDQIIVLRVLREGEPRDVKIRVEAVEPIDLSVTTIYDTWFNKARNLEGRYSFVRPQISAALTDLRPQQLVAFDELQRAQKFVTINPKISTDLLVVNPLIARAEQLVLTQRNLALASMYDQFTKAAEGKSIEARLLAEITTLEQQLAKLRALIVELEATSKSEKE